MNVAFIPVRGGSKSIPLKNIKHICGKPLVYWVTRAANECRFIDKIYIATDNCEIKQTVENFLFDKVEVIGRTQASAVDTASTELAMLEFAEQYVFENIVLIQATSPLLKSLDLDKGFEIFNSNHVDSVISVVKQKRFNWEIKQDGFAYPTNYDIFYRPRRQEFEGYYVENGAFYITTRTALIKNKNRISGNIMPAIMDESSFFEIDEPSDWVIVENLLKRSLSINPEINRNIKLFMTDCDGCLTDGGMYYSESGDELKKFNAKDGMGFKLLHENGIKTGIITGENVELNYRRACKIKADYIYCGITDKLEVLKKLCKELNIGLDNIAYVGDDINDIDVIKSVGYGCCVNDSIELLKQYADYISSKNGGAGAVRDCIDTILMNR